MARVARSTVRSVFICQSCGRESLRWLGRCPECQQWNSFVEVAASPAPDLAGSVSPPQELDQVSTAPADRMPLAIGEFDRVLGGGLVAGALVLISGDPGIGKSTLLLQAAAAVAREGKRVVYVTGEETAAQVKMRAGRLGLEGRGVFVIAGNNVDTVLEQAGQLSPALVVIDSIQTMQVPTMESTPGSIGQVTESTLRLMQWAKPRGVPVFISGHVTKEGAIAGPRVLEHMVDVVLYLEGEPFSTYRLLRGVKNRFGSTDEVGVFEMKERGLVEVTNPSKVFVSGHGEAKIGSVVVPTIGGSRPILVEIQALTTPNNFSQPRRTANGVDFNRLLLVTAVLVKRLGLKLGTQDIMVNVTGGLRVVEPAADLGIALAIASSAREIPVAARTVVVGELGLSGELRATSQLERRLAETARLGFLRCIVPGGGDKVRPPEGMEVVAATSLREAVKAGLAAGK